MSRPPSGYSYPCWLAGPEQQGHLENLVLLRHLGGVVEIVRAWERKKAPRQKVCICPCETVTISTSRGRAFILSNRTGQQGQGKEFSGSSSNIVLFKGVSL